MMPTRKDTVEQPAARVLAVSVAAEAVALQREAVAHQIEVAVLQSVVMAMMLVAEDQSAVVEAVVTRLAARSLVTMMTMAIGVS